MENIGDLFDLNENEKHKGLFLVDWALMFKILNIVFMLKYRPKTPDIWFSTFILILLKRERENIVTSQERENSVFHITVTPIPLGSLTAS